MQNGTGFSDVDASERAQELVAYLAVLADALAGMRRQDFDRLGLREGQHVLDAGCGAGEVCVELAGRVGRSGRVVGIDPSTAMIAAARTAAAAAGAPVELRVASIYELPFADASFDAVRAERVFQHLDDPARGLAELIRVTRPGGRIMVIDPDHGQHGLALSTTEQRALHAATLRVMQKMIANASIGTQLRGLFVQAGLANLDLVVRSLEIPYDPYPTMTFLDERLDAVVAAGEFTRAQADAFKAALAQRHAEGTFYANAIGYAMMGTRR
jgi:SAM-dependent methyltransferase